MPSDWTDLTDSTMATNGPQLAVYLQNNDDTYADANGTCNSNADGDTTKPDNVCFDIHPGSAYAYGSSAADAADGTGVENIAIVDNGVGEAQEPKVADICTEKWRLSPTAITCVEMQAKVKRGRNTGDTAHDIILDFSNTYTMHAMVGRVADKADETLKFETQDVDFTQFYTATGAISSFVGGATALAGMLYTLAF